MVAGGVTEQVGVIGEKEGLGSERGNARPSTVKKLRRRLNNETLVCGEPGRSETGVETGTEIHVFPPGGLVGGIEAAKALPDVAAHQPGGGGGL
jgi:hypothetical protein